MARERSSFGHHRRVPGIYDEPEFYQAACAYRDVPAEVDALLRWAGRHRGADAGSPRSVLEMAAGPAEHARELARRGLAATALDLNPAMCGRAQELAEAAGISLTVVEADMRDFSLPDPMGRFDLAVTMLNSLCHLLTLDDMLRHLDCVARHLDAGGTRRGGKPILGIGNDHPRYFNIALSQHLQRCDAEVAGADERNSHVRCFPIIVPQCSFVSDKSIAIYGKFRRINGISAGFMAARTALQARPHDWDGSAVRNRRFAGLPQFVPGSTKEEPQANHRERSAADSTQSAIGAG